jgi:UDPglucose 6-dehydrogenase
MMNLAVVGTGYVGLVAGTCFAELGHRVVCVDNDQHKLATLRAGKLPIYEPGLEEMVPKNVQRGRLSFTDDLARAVRDSDVVFIAVGTPPGEDGSADLRYVIAVAEGVADALNGFKVIVMKSTVPIGTCDRVRAIIASRSKEHFAVVSNPEFLREGVAVPDFMRPDRIIVGTSDERAVEVMRRLYRPLTADGAKFLLMDVRSSEMTKYASNSMLATRISFMNEIAALCEKVGADVENVRRGMGADTRIGSHFLKAGVGYGGSCFPKDVAALLKTAEEYTTPLRILEATTAANLVQKVRLVDLLKADLGDDLSGKRVGLWGLAFKPQTDDMREAPSLPLSLALSEAGAEVVAYDPAARHTAHQILGDRIRYAEDPYQAIEGADALCLVTEWSEFTAPDWERVWALMRDHWLYDGRNLWEPRELISQGFKYRGIGRR